MQIDSIDDILDDFRSGKIVLLMDDEDRENEGDLMVAADCVTSEHIAFFARHACGLICLTLTEKRATQLSLPLMVEQNRSMHETNFTVSIEAARGITTGISAADRATTVQAAVAPGAGPDDVVMPGHIFPLIAKRGGVLTRAGHTEAGCDLARLTGHEPAAVIVEVMNEDGTMAQRPELEEFSEKHDIKIGTIADLIEYRVINDKTVSEVDVKTISTEAGEFQLHTYEDSTSDAIHLALTKGTINSETPCLVRVQTINILRDVLGADRPGFDQSWSTSASLEAISKSDCGVLVVVGQPHAPEQELAQIQSFPEIPVADRSVAESGVYRVIGAGSQILRDLGVGKMRLLSSPTRYNALSGFGLEVIEFIEA